MSIFNCIQASFFVGGRPSRLRTVFGKSKQAQLTTLPQSAILRVSTLIDKIREIEIHEYYLIKVGYFIYPNTLFEQNLDNIKLREKPSQ